MGFLWGTLHLALAEDLSHRWSLRGAIGVGIPIGAEFFRNNTDPGPGVEGAFHYRIDRHWSIGASYDYMNMGGTDIDLQPVVATLAYSLFPSWRWTPYLEGGIGAGIVNDMPLSDGQYLTTAFKGGGGVDYAVRPDLSIGPQAFYFFFPDKGGEAPFEVEALTIGLAATWHFGGPKKEAPLDSDHDGIDDESDRCPGTPEGGPVDEVGCLLDSDGDGVPDPLDRCSETPEGAKVTAYGCLFEEKVRIDLKIEFDYDSVEIPPGYYDPIREVAEFMKKHPDTTAEIEGYTDSTGPEAYNLDLSQRRADNVRRFLIEHFGIEPERLTAKGYGERQPIADNVTREGRAQNRRVVVTLTATPIDS